jgi:hypothetical protein
MAAFCQMQVSRVRGDGFMAQAPFVEAMVMKLYRMIAETVD